VNFNFRFALAIFSNLAISLSIVQIFKKYHSTSEFYFFSFNCIFLAIFNAYPTFFHSRNLYLQFIFLDVF
jgi:hypothetical protein